MSSLILRIGNAEYPLPLEAVQGDPEAIETAISTHGPLPLVEGGKSAAGYMLKDVRFVPAADQATSTSKTIGHVVVTTKPSDLAHKSMDGNFETRYPVIDKKAKIAQDISARGRFDLEGNVVPTISERYALKETVCRIAEPRKRGGQPGNNGGRPPKMVSPKERTVTLESDDLAWLDANGGQDTLRTLVRNARLEASKRP